MISRQNRRTSSLAISNVKWRC